MQINKKDFNKILTIFLLSHVFVWTLVPSISNHNLPLDTIEALAWGSNLDWGFNKHPPLSAFFVEVFYRIFGNQDWAYYFLSQLFVVSSFLIIFKFSEDFFKNKFFSLISLFLLEGIYFYNFTTPEFNVNVCQLPFWSLTVYFCWKGVKNNDVVSWLLFGILSKYLFIYLLVAIDVFFIYLITKKKLNFKCLISLSTFALVLTPHVMWLVDNDYITITYALHRTGIEDSNFFSSHFLNPVIFLGKQIGILLPFFLMLFILLKKFTFKINLKDKKLIFLFVINIFPLIFVFLTSLFMGAKIRTMWMTPFYLFMGVLFVYIFQTKINFKKFKYFLSIFLFLFVFSPIVYYYVSVTQDDKRTDYSGKQIAQKVEKKWNENFSNKIGLVGGDEWRGGNLSYHLKSRPKWDNIFESKNIILPENNENGFILIGDSDILSKICNGIFVKVKNEGVCMLGKKK